MIELFDCERKPKTRISANHCISRQKILHKNANKNAWGRYQYLDCEMCEGCPTGLEIYQKHTGEKVVFMPKKQKTSTKVCTECGDSKPADKKNFYVLKTAKDGLHSKCKVCFNTKYSPDKKPKITEQSAKQMQTCVGKCGRTLELTAENFWRSAISKTGFEPRCKECARQAKKDRRKIRMGKAPENTIVLKLDDCPDLYQAIQAWAKKERRSVDQQILHHLETSIISDSAA